MALYKEGMVINPKRKKNRKVKVNPDYITTDEYCIAFEPGDVTNAQKSVMLNARQNKILPQP